MLPVVPFWDSWWLTFVTDVTTPRYHRADATLPLRRRSPFARMASPDFLLTRSSKLRIRKQRYTGCETRKHLIKHRFSRVSVYFWPKMIPYNSFHSRVNMQSVSLSLDSYNFEIFLCLTSDHSLTSWKSITLFGPPNLPKVSLQFRCLAISGSHLRTSWTFGGIFFSMASTMVSPMDGRYLKPSSH